MFIFYILFTIIPARASALLQEKITPHPIYQSLSPNLNDFDLYANGGWDGNWYVGFNNCWIVELPPAPLSRYARAFIGAKLGRAKTQPKEGPNSKPWERQVILGKIYMAVSPAPAFTSEQSFFLASTQDISLEPTPGGTMPGLGESRWFWTEVPLNLISLDRPNYLALWSNTDYFVSASSSPIVAGAETRSKETHVWLNRSVRGMPPIRTEGALEIPIVGLRAALAIKLIPPNASVVSVSPLDVSNLPGAALIQVSAEGQDIESVWVERSYDQFTWERVTPLFRQPPYIFTLPSSQIPREGFFLRGAAKDALENKGVGPSLQVAPPP